MRNTVGAALTDLRVLGGVGRMMEGGEGGDGMELGIGDCTKPLEGQLGHGN